MKRKSRVGTAHRESMRLFFSGQCSSYAPAALACALLVTVGCGGAAYEYDATVTGIVTIDGELANTGTVVFHPLSKDGRPAIGHIHPDGGYSLRTGQGDLRKVDGGTVMSGDYLVTVTVNAPPAEGAVLGEAGPPIPGPSLIAARYTTKDTTDLRYTVKPGRQVINLKLERAALEPPAERSADESNDNPDEAREPETTTETATE